MRAKRRRNKSDGHRDKKRDEDERHQHPSPPFSWPVVVALSKAAKRLLFASLRGRQLFFFSFFLPPFLLEQQRLSFVKGRKEGKIRSALLPL